jgi:DnaJ-class molecular chaperone
LFVTTCPNCTGTGLVARAVAPLADNDHVRRHIDQMPHAGQELCSRCDGSGEVKFDPATVVEEKSAGL